MLILYNIIEGFFPGKKVMRFASWDLDQDWILPHPKNSQFFFFKSQKGNFWYVC